MLNKVRTQIDPYFIRPDDEAMVRVQADVNEEEDDPIPWGEYGPYCPATLIQDGWLVPGKNEFEAYFQGKRHKFYGEKEQAYFKENISEFYHQNAIQVLKNKNIKKNTNILKLSIKQKIKKLNKIISN